ncbi:MAG: putative lipopolysaccharide heptosyltransferase III, partial [Acidobacteriota bacterium]|nr:putative lipopolysaccharide heptosyltransferase III [Acidobacteriota bacterium]
GSSNRDQWGPWTDAPHRVVFTPLECQPCPGDICSVYGDPKCIIEVTVDQVTAAIDQILR